MRILITGGAGFIGSHLVDALLKEHEVFVVDNFETGKHENLPIEISMRELCDISHKELMENIFKYFCPELVIHAAASYKDPDNWEEDARTNCVGTAVICQLCRKYKIKKLIYFQTSLCYGVNPYEGRYINPYPLPITFSINPAPNSYAITKTAGEQIIAMSGVPFVSLRLANIYGPRNLTGPIPTFFKKLISFEECNIVKTRRDFVYITDLVDLVIRIISGEGREKYYHVSSGLDYSIQNIFETIFHIVGPKINWQSRYFVKDKNPDDVETILLDPSETLKDFPGWNVKVNIVRGLEEMIKWYYEHPFKESYTHLKQGD